MSGRITETEAYVGTTDPASHAFGGFRGANNSMYGAAGTVYIYFTYGIHFMLNIVLGGEGFPCAILIRAATPEEGLERMRQNRGPVADNLLACGPGNLCRAFGIDKSIDGCNFFGGEIWLEATRVEGHIKTSGRIGIGDRGAGRPWRFYLAGHTSVSGPVRLKR
jgi:DNA-3-methyladenine glycosylase